MLNSLLEKKVGSLHEQRGNFGTNTETIRKPNGGISLADSMLPMQGAWGSISGQGTRSHMLQLKILLPQWRSKILCAATKTQRSQINKKKAERKG